MCPATGPNLGRWGSGRTRQVGPLPNGTVKKSLCGAEEDKLKHVLRGACFSLPSDSFTVPDGRVAGSFLAALASNQVANA